MVCRPTAKSTFLYRLEQVQRNEMTRVTGEQSRKRQKRPRRRCGHSVFAIHPILPPTFAYRRSCMWLDIHHALLLADWPGVLAPTCKHVASGAPVRFEPIMTAVDGQGGRAAARVDLSIWKSWRPWVIRSKGSASLLFHPPSNHIVVHPVATGLPPLNLNVNVQSPSLCPSPNHADATATAAKLQ